MESSDIANFGLQRCFIFKILAYGEIFKKESDIKAFRHLRYYIRAFFQTAKPYIAHLAYLANGEVYAKCISQL